MKICLSIALFLLSLAFNPCNLNAAEFEVLRTYDRNLANLTPMYRPSKYWSGDEFDLPANRSDIQRNVDDTTNYSVDSRSLLIRMTGRIEKGDLETLQSLTEDEGGLFFFSLVLASPGGDFLEAIKIGEWLRLDLQSQDPTFGGSYVLNGDECLSACALIFALSSHRRSGDDTDSSRYLEEGGRVGFHMGILPDNLASQKIPVRDSMNLTYDIMAAYMVLITEETSPPDLIVEALKAREADEFFFVEAGPEAYDLGFIPVSKGPLSEPLSLSALNMEHAELMCGQLFDISQEPETILTDENPYFGSSFYEGAVNELFADDPTAVLHLSNWSGMSCFLARSENGNLMIDVTSEPVDCTPSDPSLKTPCTLEREVEFFATNALLADISGCPGGRLHPEINATSNRFDFEWDSGAALERSEFGYAKVLRSVNMRAAPSLDAERVDQLAEGTDLRLRDCAITNDGQAVWLEVESRTSRGWVSARFVRLQYVEWMERDSETWCESSVDGSSLC